MRVKKSSGVRTVMTVSLLLLTQPIFAQDDPTQPAADQKAGTVGATELLIPVGSVGSALGGTNIGYVSGCEAIHWNPAGVANIPGKVDILVSNLNYLADIDVSYVAGVFKVGEFGALGLSFKTLSFGDIAITNNISPDGTGETFSPNYLTVGITYSRVMTDKINIGASAKVVSERILRESALGVAFDFGVQYKTPIGLNFGVTMKNVGPQMQLDGDDLEIFTNDYSTRPDAEGQNFRVPVAKFSLPTSFELGLTYVAKLSELNSLALNGLLMNTQFGFDQYSFAVDFDLHHILFLRGSYTFGWDSGDDKLRSNEARFIFGPAFGAGIKLGSGKNFYMSFDYAYRATDLFNDNQWISLTFGF